MFYWFVAELQADWLTFSDVTRNSLSLFREAFAPLIMWQISFKKWTACLTLGGQGKTEPDFDSSASRPVISVVKLGQCPVVWKEEHAIKVEVFSPLLYLP